MEDKGVVSDGMMLCIGERLFLVFYSKFLFCERGLLGDIFVFMIAKFGYDI